MRLAGPFTVRGRMGGAPVTVTWADARLSGTPVAIDAVRATLDRNDRVRLTPQGDDRPAEVGDPTAVLAAVQDAFDAIDSVEGDYPMPEPDSSAS